MSDKNAFGGGNKNSLYVPLSEIEQEVLHILKERGDYRVKVHGWGFVEDPKVTVGDLRVAVHFQLCFNKPKEALPLYYLDLTLLTGSGRILHKGRMETKVNNQPLMVQDGIVVDFTWDIALKGLDPKLVREVLPHTTGLTSRQQDALTGDFTSEGNMKLTPHQKNLLRTLRAGEALVKKGNS